MTVTTRARGLDLRRGTPHHHRAVRLVSDERVADIVESIVRHAKMPPDVRHVPIEEARAKMGPFADALALNQIVRCPRSKELGWAPTSHSVAGSVARLLEDFRAKHEAA